MHYIDVNSLYPSQMKSNKLPYKLLAYFKGDITKMVDYREIFENNTGFCNVKVTSTKYILHPILPVKLNGHTIFHIVTWTMWYNLE